MTDLQTCEKEASDIQAEVENSEFEHRLEDTFNSAAPIRSGISIGGVLGLIAQTLSDNHRQQKESK